MVESHLVNFAGHDRFAHTATAKVTNGPAEPGKADPAKIVAAVGKRRIGMMANAKAHDTMALRRERPGHGMRKVAPAGQKTDRARGIRVRAGRRGTS